MKSIYQTIIEENINYAIVKNGSKWYIENIDFGGLCGSGFPTKKAAMMFMDNLKKTFEAK